MTEGTLVTHFLDQKLNDRERRRKLENQMKKLTAETKWMNRAVHLLVQPRLLREASDRVVNTSVG